MGMHFGAIGAKTSWPALLSELSRSFGKFGDMGPVASFDRLPFGDADDGIVAGELGGSSFVFDKAMIMSASNYDLLVEMSGRLDSLVVASVGETVSGTYGLMAADRGRLVRLYWNCHMSLSRALEMGTPLASEAESPLEDIDGRGLMDAMRDLGMDFDAWRQHGAKQAYSWELDESHSDVFESRGPIGTAQAEHRQRYGIPKDRQPKPTVVSRRMPDGSIGYDIVAAAPSRSGKSVFAKLRSLFRL